MGYKVFFITTGLLFCSTYGTPTTKRTKFESTSTLPSSSDQEQLVQPQFISIEHFEELLKRAGEIFAPVQLLEALPVEAPPIPPVPYGDIQPPKEQPYNYYLPMYDFESVKLDAKTRKLEHFAPPPPPPAEYNKQHLEENRNSFALKPKKLPKKFDAGAKQVNIKWLNALEKGGVLLVEDMTPKAAYMEHDERNRINFDDSFFAVDTPVQITDNEPHKEHKGEAAVEEGYFQQAEDTSGEDLLAVSAAQLPQISHAFRRLLQG